MSPRKGRTLPCQTIQPRTDTLATITAFGPEPARSDPTTKDSTSASRAGCGRRHDRQEEPETTAVAATSRRNRFPASCARRPAVRCRPGRPDLRRSAGVRRRPRGRSCRQPIRRTSATRRMNNPVATMPDSATRRAARCGHDPQRCPRVPDRRRVQADRRTESLVPAVRPIAKPEARPQRRKDARQSSHTAIEPSPSSACGSKSSDPPTTTATPINPLIHRTRSDRRGTPRGRRNTHMPTTAAIHAKRAPDSDQ